MFTATPFASSESIAAFLDGLLAEQEQAATHERRAHPRGCLFGFLDVQPLNDALKPVDEPFMVAVRDISQGGLSFLHDSPPTVRYFAVTLTAASGKELCAPPRRSGPLPSARSTGEHRLPLPVAMTFPV